MSRVRNLGTEPKVGYSELVRHLVQVYSNIMNAKHTDFDVPSAVHENVVALDVTVDDVLGVEMLQALASLRIS